MADDGRDVRRADEPAGPRSALRRRDAEALVGQQHDAHVRRVRRRAVAWVLWAFKMGFGTPIGADTASSTTFIGNPGSVLSPERSRGRHRFRRSRPARIPLPRVVTGLLPVRLRGDHAAPDARLRPGPDQLQGVDPVRAAVDHVRLRDQRLPDLGRRLLRGPRRAGLLGWVRDPPGGRDIGVRRRGGDRTKTPAGPRDRCPEQPVDGRLRCGPAVARLERLQRRGLLLRRRERVGGGVEHQRLHGRRDARLDRLGLHLP